VVEVDAVAELAELAHGRERQRVGGGPGAAADAGQDDQPGEQGVELDAAVERRRVVESDRVPQPEPAGDAGHAQHRGDDHAGLAVQQALHRPGGHDQSQRHAREDLAGPGVGGVVGDAGVAVGAGVDPGRGEGSRRGGGEQPTGHRQPLAADPEGGQQQDREGQVELLLDGQ
jgi:hypothetical protein